MTKLHLLSTTAPCVDFCSAKGHFRGAKGNKGTTPRSSISIPQQTSVACRAAKVALVSSFAELKTSIKVATWLSSLALTFWVAVNPCFAQSTLKIENKPLATEPRHKIFVTSSLDGSQQPSYLTLSGKVEKLTAGSRVGAALVPMVVSLHSWSADLEQRVPELEELLKERQWVCLQPNFRGINDHPDALASLAAEQDIIDAVDWVLERYNVDPKRIYLVGISGGGHMTMLMTAKHPKRWRAASAWVGINDLSQWHALHRDSKYGEMMRKCCGGAPGDSLAVDKQYLLRSPKSFLKLARTSALDIAAGIHDGHSGSVPIHHSLDAFNEIAAENNDRLISKIEIEQLSKKDGRLQQPTAGDVGFDADFGRQHYLRRVSGDCRVTIFEGGHEGLATAALAWFDAHP